MSINFYETTGQVIPVFLIAVLLETAVRHNPIVTHPTVLSPDAYEGISGFIRQGERNPRSSSPDSVAISRTRPQQARERVLSYITAATVGELAALGTLPADQSTSYGPAGV